VRKEALLSSQIEGTQSSFSELLLSEHPEAPGLPGTEVAEVSSYVAAMQHGLSRLKEGFPLSLRLLREIHGVLLRSGRGAELQRGEFRTSQNWVGGTRPGNALYVPPPHEVLPLMGALENFLHDQPVKTSLLIKAALAHVQFETIHPFLDGNGRLGRLMVTLLLRNEDALREPLLYLSLYFKRHRAAYYDLLQRVRIAGAWEEWLRFFLRGVLDTADQAVSAARQTLAMFEEHRRQIESLPSVGSAQRLHHVLKSKPVLSAPEAARLSGLSEPTVRAAFGSFEGLGIVREVTRRRRDRLWLYAPYVELLAEGTEPLPADRR
jgi:Fic family protein